MKTVITGVLALILLAQAAPPATAQDAPERDSDGGRERGDRAQPYPVSPESRDDRSYQGERDGRPWRGEGADRGGADPRARPPTVDAAPAPAQPRRPDLNDPRQQRPDDRPSGQWDDRRGRNDHHGPDRPRGWDDRRRWDNGRGWEDRRGSWDRGLPSRPPPSFWFFGDILPQSAWAESYIIGDWWRYGLPRPALGCIWIRSGDDALMADRVTGRIRLIIRDVFW